MFLLVILVPVTLNSCKKDRLSKEEFVWRRYRTAAYQFLDQASKNSFIEGWQKAAVTDEIKDGKAVKVVTFHTKYDALLGSIIVYLNPASNEIIGVGARF